MWRGRTDVKLMLKTWVKQTGITDIGAYFSVRDAQAQLEPWLPLLSVSSCGYMQGYQKLKVPGVPPVHRILARFVDCRCICRSFAYSIGPVVIRRAGR